MIDCTVTLNASLESLPRRIEDRFTGVTSIFCKKPELMSSTTEVPDCKALLKAFWSSIPGVA